MENSNQNAVNSAEPVKKERKANGWISHCQGYAKKNKCSYRQAMASAGKSYKAGKAKSIKQKKQLKSYKKDKKNSKKV